MRLYQLRPSLRKQKSNGKGFCLPCPPALGSQGADPHHRSSIFLCCVWFSGKFLHRWCPQRPLQLQLVPVALSPEGQRAPLSRSSSTRMRVLSLAVWGQCPSLKRSWPFCGAVARPGSRLTLGTVGESPAPQPETFDGGWKEPGVRKENRSRYKEKGKGMLGRWREQMCASVLAAEEPVISAPTADVLTGPWAHPCPPIRQQPRGICSPIRLAPWHYLPQHQATHCCSVTFLPYYFPRLFLVLSSSLYIYKCKQSQ